MRGTLRPDGGKDVRRLHIFAWELSWIPGGGRQEPTRGMPGRGQAVAQSLLFTSLFHHGTPTTPGARTRRAVDCGSSSTSGCLRVPRHGEKGIDDDEHEQELASHRVVVSSRGEVVGST